MKFRTKLPWAGKTATGFEVPAKVVAGPGRASGPPAGVTINGYAYRPDPG